MTGPVGIRLLGPDDEPAFQALRLRALREHPDAFLATPEEQAALAPAERARRLTPDESQGVLGAFEDGALVGTVGFLRPSRPKTRHGATIWGMYVAPERRGRGLGRALLAAAIAHLRRLPGLERVLLSVVATNAAARALYESAGFVTWGTEPAAVALGDRRLDEHHMVLSLSPPPQGPADSVRLTGRGNDPATLPLTQPEA